MAMTRSAATDARPEQATSPAEIYDRLFVPALFAPWGRVLCGLTGVASGQRVLDVGCGTGALTLAAAERVAPGGAVVGLDANPEMLAVARRKPIDVAWHEGRAEALPFDDASFDAVLSQFAMMFFDDSSAALREMRRVLRADARLVVAVCDAVAHSPGYAALAALLDRLFGRPIGDAFRAPFALGDAERLRGICAEAGLADAHIERRDGLVRFASVDAMVSAERACVWTLGGLLDEGQFARLREAAQDALRAFVKADGRIEFTMPALLISAPRAPGGGAT
jgi:ubiquinone/menaquinone biosynthesis C-methylase UbiE